MKKIETLKRYLISIILPLFINIVLFLFFYFIADAETTRIIDAFQVSGLLIVLFICLLIVSDLGAFDMLIFGTKKLFGRLFPLSKVNTSETYYDYVVAKSEKRKKKLILWPGILIGLISIAIGFLFY